ncbi:hypothetical protein ACWD5B_14940 [Streptomyces tanashiensis]|uniref:hypothetical protein n=1 Tax=Streptomyces tanashiensis TaxID=67367 RepID=UPI0036AB13AB
MPSVPGKEDLGSVLESLSQSKLLNLEDSVRKDLTPEVLKAASEDGTAVFCGTSFMLVLRPQVPGGPHPQVFVGGPPEK